MEKLLLTNDKIKFRTDNGLLITVDKFEHPTVYREALHVIEKYKIPCEDRRAV